MVRPLYDLGPVVKNFRDTIRPAMVGRIGRIEPILADRYATTLYRWLRDVVEEALSSTEIRSRRGDLRKQLVNGIRITGRRNLRTMQARIWTQPWVFPHEYGATIAPKTKRNLAIPFAYGVHPDGRPKFRSPNSWRRYGSFVLTHKSDGRKFIVYKSGKELRYLYVLVDEVDIPPRLGLNKLADQRLGELLVDFGELFIRYALPLLDVDKFPGARL